MSDLGGRDLGTRDRSMAVFDRRVESAAEARSWLSSFLHERDVDEATVGDAALVVSELVTNALRHGAGPTVLRASLTPTEVQLSVTDSGDGEPHMLPPEPGRVGGLGLVVVDRVTTEWGVSPFPGGKTVWALLARGSRSGEISTGA
jgi:anti-sigma regulatory factor (Ser/Thr protein kinase)